jgi:hypothetical protein
MQSRLGGGDPNDMYDILYIRSFNAEELIVYPAITWFSCLQSPKEENNPALQFRSREGSLNL